MKDTSKQALESIGVDLPQTLGRFVNNEGLLFKFLAKFLTDQTYAQLQAAMASGDTEDAFHQAHTLKGVVGNLGLGDLFRATDEIVEPLRNGDMATATAAYPAVEAAYAHTMEVLRTVEELS